MSECYDPNVLLFNYSIMNSLGTVNWGDFGQIFTFFHLHNDEFNSRFHMGISL